MTVLKHGETAGREVSKRVLAPVADESALALVSSTDCVHLASIRVGAAWWYYDSASTDAASAGTVVMPADSPSAGRFLIDNPLGDVPAARTITAGAGLTGGGDLSANRTLAVGAGTGITVNADDVAVTFGLVGEMAAAGVAAANAVGTTDKSARVDHAHAHGAQVLGDGTNHAVATGAVAGFMSAADKTHIDLTPTIQEATVTLASGTATINTVITLAANSRIICNPVGDITGSTDYAHCREKFASRVNGGAGVATAVIEALAANGTKDADAAGDVHLVILTPHA